MADEVVPARPIDELEAHPDADRFPLMSEAQLRKLADSIGEDGLFHAIVLDDQDRILDGRNRYRACKIAGVKPRFERASPGDDPLGYVIRANVDRRHLTDDQTAMVAAAFWPDFESRRGRPRKVHAPCRIRG